MLGIYSFSALTGSAFSYWFNPSPAVGASGAIFGLLGCLTAFHVKYERQLGEAGKHRLKMLAQMAGMNLLLGLMSRNVDNFAHVGGFLGGAALTLALC
jgi:membrane associated rhomboid family serine protease